MQCLLPLMSVSRRMHGKAGRDKSLEVGDASKVLDRLVNGVRTRVQLVRWVPDYRHSEENGKVDDGFAVLTSWISLVGPMHSVKGVALPDAKSPKWPTTTSSRWGHHWLLQDPPTGTRHTL